MLTVVGPLVMGMTTHDYIFCAPPVSPSGFICVSRSVIATLKICSLSVGWMSLTKRCGDGGIVRVNSILPPNAQGWARAVLFLLTNCRRAPPDSTPKIAYTYLPCPRAAQGSLGDNTQS